MSFIRVIILVIVLSCMIGCSGSLSIVNKTESPAFFKKHIIYSNGDSSTTTYELPSNGGITIIVQRNNWTRSNIRRYVHEISVLEIISINDTITISDQENIVDYLCNRRKGLFNQEIVIKVEEN